MEADDYSADDSQRSSQLGETNLMGVDVNMNLIDPTDFRQVCKEIAEYFCDTEMEIEEVMGVVDQALVNTRVVNAVYCPQCGCKIDKVSVWCITDVRDCTTCAHEDCSSRLPPCYTCDRNYESTPSNWEAKWRAR